MTKSTAEANRDIAYRLSNNLPRLLREFSRDFERRIWRQLNERGYPEIRPAHVQVFANLGLGSVRVSDLAARAQVTQQAMGKMLKELERLGFIARDIDSGDKRAKEIRLTDKGIQLAEDSLKVVDQIQQEYREKVGTEELEHLEDQLRRVVQMLELEYLPESWAADEPR
ncbi:MarR family winged helix-turn-helix transcriptional regulator [Halioglobus maricola]|uniref:MarR family winged helix-turn-helix transcriptional regulator n=1 Tax=Halioglobus maricola TaxID=2601894 RepID=UPI001478F0D8|nr:MarR family transcriptional regulator [Halioglobus maricola]